MAIESSVPLRPLRVLVIDDEKNIRTTLAVCLEGLGCEVTQAANGAAALATLARQIVDIAFLDLRLGTENGLEVLPALLAERPGLEVVIITAYATIETAVEAIKRGARDYLPKPFTPAQIRHVIEQTQERRRQQAQVLDLQARLAETSPEADLTTASPKMQAALDIVTKAAAFEVPVLLRGENGTGKGVLARTLHALSSRRDRPFVVVNCPTLSDELLASELFGHAKGAFTGAVRDQEGKVEAAEGGTLFLDEIGEVPAGLQAKLLRFLQDKEFERVGETRTRRADVRVVAATNRDLDAAVKDGSFREDLLYRLNTIEVTVPSLRERREDLLRLASNFVTFFSRHIGRAPPQLNAEAERALLSYGWPGNVRELRNAIERALILSSGPVVGPEAFIGRIAASPPSAGPTLGGDVTVEEIEREHITRVLARTATQEEAARILGLDTSTLWRKRKKYEA